MFCLSDVTVTCFFFFSSSTVNVWRIYVCSISFVSFSLEKSLNNTNTGNVNENIEFVTMNLPLQSASAPLFTRNKGVGSPSWPRNTDGLMLFCCRVRYVFSSVSTGRQRHFSISLFLDSKSFLSRVLVSKECFFFHTFSEHCLIGKK